MIVCKLNKSCQILFINIIFQIVIKNDFIKLPEHLQFAFSPTPLYPSLHVLLCNSLSKGSLFWQIWTHFGNSNSYSLVFGFRTCHISEELSFFASGKHFLTITVDGLGFGRSKTVSEKKSYFTIIMESNFLCYGGFSCGS